MKRLGEFQHIIFCLLIIGLAILALSGSARAAEYHLVPSGEQAVIDEHGVCRVVTNTTSKIIYVPTKTPEEWSSFYNTSSGSVTAPACAGCALDGATVAHGASRTFYMSSRSCHGTCGAISQTRNCYNGVLDGSTSYSKATCPSPTCAGCTTANVNWATSPYTCTASAVGGSHGTSRNISDSAAPSTGSASFTCDDGAWSRTSGSCAAANCARPWGGTVSHGSSITAYRYATASCGSSCQPQTRTCNNGSLSGSYSNQSCSAATCANCSLAGVTVNHGTSRTFYSSSSVACGSSCSGQSRTCNNGTLSGSASYNKASCSVAGCASCTKPWGGTMSHGSSVTAYQTSSVAYGGSCKSQTRICDDGALSGSYQYGSCSVQGPANCSATNHSWSGCSASIPSRSSGQSVTVSNTASNYTGSIRASCSNGNWSYSNASCAASGCAAGTLSGNWGSGCQGSTSVPSASEGTVLQNAIHSTMVYTTGTADASCYQGEWVLVGVSCTVSYSDLRLKTGLQCVGRLKGHNIYEFSYRADPLHRRFRGVIAQEVLDVPSAVIKMPSGYYAVDYAVLGVPFVEVNNHRAKNTHSSQNDFSNCVSTRNL